MFKKKTLLMLVSLLAVLCVTVGGTLAYLAAESNSVVNTFQPSQVTTYVDEKTGNGVKTNVRIKNTGDIDAYIRATMVITWKNDKGEVSGIPVKDGDYNISFGTGWSEIEGYYYWNGKVTPNGYTGALITRCSPVEGKAPTGYTLSVEIIGSGIQADGVTGTTPAVPAVQDAWGEAAARAVGAIQQGG